MYREFFGLTTLPFNNTPDPRFFFNTPDHEEALASLLYAVEARKGFVMVTGEVGSGKTLLSRLLLNRLPSNVRTAVITNTNLSGPELLTAICREFGLEIDSGTSAAEMTVVLEQFLLEQYSKDRLAVVILDEAQNLPNDSLEQLRMLGNLEADDAKLLQVLILGQPELQEAFRQPAMQQTFQRIFRTFHLQGLDREMSAAYIAHRLKIAGLDLDRQVFDDRAIEAIYEYAQGIPRLINQICDNAMLAAYGESRSDISAQFIREVVEQMMTLAAPPSHMLGEEAQDSPIAAEASGPAISTIRGVNSEDPSQSVRPEDISPEHLNDLTERLAAMEKSLKSSDEETSSSESVRRLQYESLRMVRNLVLNTQDTDRQMRDILNRTQWTALAAEERAAAEARLSDEQRELLKERTERLIRETQALARDQQSQFTQEADRRMRELLDKARQSARAVEESAQADIETGRKQNAVIQEQTTRLMEEMRSLARSEHSKFAKTAEQQMKELLEQARHTTQATEERAVTDTENTRRRNAEVQAQIRDLMSEVQELAKNHRSELASVIAQQQAELETVKKLRAETIELNEKTVGFQAECERRVRKTAENAETLCERLQAQATSVVTEASLATQDLRDQVRKMLAEANSRGEASQTRAAELLAQQRADSEAARRNIDEFTSALSGNAAEAERDNKSVLDNLRTEAAGILEQIRDIHDHTQAKAQQVNYQVEEFVGDMQSKVETSHRKIGEIVATADHEVKTACASLQTARDQILTEGENSRKQTEEALEQTKSLLGETRDRCADLLSSLRDQITEQTAKARDIWQASAREGSETLSELNARLADARKKTENTRSEFESLIQSANRELTDSRSALESGIKAHKDDVARLAADARNIKTDLLEKFEAAKSALDETLEQHRRGVDERVAGIVRISDERIAQAESNAAGRVERLKSELDNAARQAEKVCDELRESIESGIKTHKNDVARLTEDAHKIKSDLLEKFEAAKSALEETLEQHHRGVHEQMAGIVRKSDERIAQVESKAAGQTERLKTELGSAARQAEKVCDELHESIRTVQGNAAVCQTQFRIESDTIQKELIELVEQNRGALEDARTTVKSLAQKAGQTIETARTDINRLEEEARDGMKNIGADFETMLSDAMAQADAIRSESESKAADLAERMERTRDGAAETVAKADEATGHIRQQSKRSLGEVRACLSQMNERSEILRRDLLHMGEEIREAATTTTKQVQDAGERVAAHVESLREIAQRDADANHDRLSALRHQVEESAEKMRQNAGKLLDQVQAGTSALRQHADQLLAQAQSGSEKLNESAAGMLMQAQTASEQFRERAEQLLHQAETTAGEVGHDVRELRSQIKTESQQVEQQAAAIKHDIAEAHQDAARLRNDTAESRKEAREQADQFLKRAEAVQKQSEALLSMPRKLVDEAKQQAGALAQMSTKISTVVHQLSSAGKTARKHKEELEGANVAADEKLTLLKQHTKRVGQLVGIIRQLYGAMDARIARLRGRLIKADDLVRSVPQEIEILRNAFESSDRLDARHEGALPTMGAAPAPAKPVVRTGSAKAAAVAGGPASNLGQIVQRNQKLNDWLRDMVGEEAVAENVLKTTGKDHGQQTVQIKT